MQIKEAIIVEGKYDKQKLSGIVDATIIETRGFRIFKDKTQKEYIKKIANEQGIVILTDSDSAGFLIRNHLKSFIPESQIKQAFILQVKGKEKRKEKSSAEGFLGVEGMDSDNIIKALIEAGCNKSNDVKQIYVTADLYKLGLIGQDNSKAKREEFLGLLGLPSYLSTKELLKYMNLNQEKSKQAFEQFINK